MKPILAFAFCVFTILSFGQSKSDNDKYCRQSLSESLQAIRPGVPGKQPFWNEKAKMFKYVPSFQNDNKSWIVSNPKYYRYTAFSFADKQYYTFSAETPYETLLPIWDKLPNGEVYLKVEAVSQDEKTFVLAGSRLFTKVEAFSPPYPNAKYSYTEALMKGLRFMYNQTHMKNWYKAGKPDHKSHQVYCYSALEVGSVIDAMLLYDRYFPENDTSLVIAKKAADYLISNVEPQGNPLEYFPQIYEGTNMLAGNYTGEIIMNQPATTGMSFLSLYDRTKEKKYLKAAERIADTYLKTQLASGTWYIRVYKETGEPASGEFCIPINISNFLSILVEKYQYSKYKKAVDSSIEWIWANPMKTFNWTGQFEDVSAAKPYHNLSKYEASWFAQYLLINSGKDASYVSQAKELIAFCEDQFVVWAKPGIYDNWGNATNGWRTPSVLEQYMCYVPIDASAVQMIDTFYLAFEITGDSIYREKALTLVNSVVNSQYDNGMIPTFWSPGFEEFWNNCMVSSLVMLSKISAKP